MLIAPMLDWKIHENCKFPECYIRVLDQSNYTNHTLQSILSQNVNLIFF